MNANRFDTLSKHLSARFSRRTALRSGSAGLAAVTLGVLAGGSVAAQGATPAAQGTSQVATAAPGSPIHPVVPAKIEYLFTQTFASGTWKPKAGAKDTYTLTLTEAPAETVYFSDRPERVVGLFPTEKFLDKLGFTPANPPNAALVASPSGGGDQDILVIELMNPVYDEGGHPNLRRKDLDQLRRDRPRLPGPAAAGLRLRGALRRGWALHRRLF